MADLELHNQEFEINVALDGSEQTIRVQPDETSDGVEFYNCFTGEDKITQIRLDEEGTWDQIWGELEQTEVDAIGKAIQNK